jgi:hypothetical protein
MQRECKCGHNAWDHEDFDGLSYCDKCSCKLYEPVENLFVVPSIKRSEEQEKS